MGLLWACSCWWLVAQNDTTDSLSQFLFLFIYSLNSSSANTDISSVLFSRFSQKPDDVALAKCSLWWALAIHLLEAHVAPPQVTSPPMTVLG